MYENFSGILVVDSTFDVELANEITLTNNCNVWYLGVPKSLEELVQSNNLQTPFIIRTFEPLEVEQL